MHIGYQTQKLVGNIGRQQSRDLCGIVGGQHFNDIEGNEIRSTQTTQELERLPTGNAADLWCASTGRIRGINEINVECEERGNAAYRCWA